MAAEVGKGVLVAKAGAAVAVADASVGVDSPINVLHPLIIIALNNMSTNSKRFIKILFLADVVRGQAEFVQLIPGFLVRVTPAHEKNRTAHVGRQPPSFQEIGKMLLAFRLDFSVPEVSQGRDDTGAKICPAWRFSGLCIPPEAVESRP